MRIELLQHLAQRIVDAVIVDARCIEIDGRIVHASILEVVLHALHDVAVVFVAAFGREGIDLVHEDGVLDVRVGLLELGVGLDETRDGILVFVLSVDDPDNGAGRVEDAFGVKVGIEKVDLAGKIPDRIGAVGSEGVRRDLSGEIG